MYARSYLSFVVGDELFWGNDRLERAVDWAKSGPSPSGRG
jgi:hypothetical protein